MKKLYGIILFLGLLLSVFSFSASADNNVSNINIDVTVRQDGSAYVVQEWTGDYDEGTENYIPINTDDINITDFRVFDAKGYFTFVDNWDIKASFKEKARKCGIVYTKDGVELCFGISNYGSNKYSIEYIVQDFIKSYTDYDGTNFMFVNPNMDTFPTDCKVNISLENGVKLNEQNAGVWAFGYEGMVVFNDGVVSAYTSDSLYGSQRVIIMLQLEKGIISPITYKDISFEEVKNRAFEGSDYTEEIDWTFIIPILFILTISLTTAIIAIVMAIIRKREIRKFYMEAPYFRDVPNNNNLTVSNYLAVEFDVTKEKNSIIGAVMLTMINRGEIETIIEESVTSFGKIREKISFKLIREPKDILGQKLYNILVLAAGDDDILAEKELEKYTYKNPELLENFIKETKDAGAMVLKMQGAFLKKHARRIRGLSEIGKRELSETMGYKKFLEEFSLIDERGLKEAEIWKEYLVYAILFGIADKVQEQLKKVYPEILPEIENYNRNVIICHSYYRTMNKSYQKYQNEQRNSGGGGSASFGGGGGFSGGGFGGGSR